MDKISFTGSFKISNQTPKILDKIYEEIIPTKRIILPDIPERGDFFFVTKNCYDRDIAEYLLSKNIKFTYFPKIDLMQRLSKFEPNEAINIIKSQNESYSLPSQISKYIKSLKYAPKPLVYKQKENDHVSKTLKALNLNEKDVVIKTKNHVTKIFNKEGKLISKISPNTKEGTNYAIVYPKYDDENVQLISIDYLGKIIKKSEDLISDFMAFQKDFISAVKMDAGRKGATT